METLLNANGYEVQRLETVNEVMTAWPFLVEGLAKLNELFKQPKHISESEYLRVVLQVIDHGKPNGIVGIAYENGKPAAYGIIFNNSIDFKPKSAVVYAAYTVSKKEAILTLLRSAELWGKKYDYAELQAFSPRFTGASFNLFEKRYGFRRQLVLFTKGL